MFNWLRAMGKNIEDAYDAFKEYKGKTSYAELGLELPTPMEQDGSNADEWSHMSDYDAMGCSPISGYEQGDVNI